MTADGAPAGLDALWTRVLAVHADALADTWPSVPDADRGWPVTIAVDELAVLALSWPPDRQRPLADQRKDTLHFLDKLAATISAGGPPPRTSRRRPSRRLPPQSVA
jgi:hypothetical protein